MVLTTEEKSQIENALIAARNAGIDNLNNELYANAYDLAYEIFSTKAEMPELGIDPYSLIWLNGAREINRGQGAYSEFIRDYTITQAQARTGETYTQNQAINLTQLASNRIADAVLSDIIASETLPSIDQIANDDATNAISTIDELGVEAWSGNLLFLFLNHQTSFNQYLLEAPGDTYDLLLAFETATSLGLNLFGNTIPLIWDFLTTDGDLTQSLVLSAAGDGISFFVDAYGLDAVTSLVKSSPFSLVEFNIDSVFGTEGDDENLITDGSLIADIDVIHAGSGNDRIIGNISNDELIDGGEGTDILDYSETGEKLTITINSIGETEANYIGTVDDTGITGLLDLDTVFNVETIIGSSNNDIFSIEVAKDNLALDGGEGDEDRLEFRDASASVTINTAPGTIIIDGQTTNFTNIELLEGSKFDDVIVGSEEEETFILQGEFEDYQLEFFEDGTVGITDSQNDRDGSDLLTDIEFAQFDDRTVDLRPGQDIAFEEEGAICVTLRLPGSELVSNAGIDGLVDASAEDIIRTNQSFRAGEISLFNSAFYGSSPDLELKFSFNPSTVNLAPFAGETYLFTSASLNIGGNNIPVFNSFEFNPLLPSKIVFNDLGGNDDSIDIFFNTNEDIEFNGSRFAGAVATIEFKDSFNLGEGLPNSWRDLEQEISFIQFQVAQDGGEPNIGAGFNYNFEDNVDPNFELFSNLDIPGDGFDNPGSEENNNPPLAVNDSFSTLENSEITFDVLANDSDPDNNPLEIIQINGDSSESQVLDSGAIISLTSDDLINYNPLGQFDFLEEGEITTDTFSYTIADSFGNVSTANITVNIEGISEALNTEPIPDENEITEPSPDEDNIDNSEVENPGFSLDEAPDNDFSSSNTLGTEIQLQVFAPDLESPITEPLISTVRILDEYTELSTLESDTSDFSLVDMNIDIDFGAGTIPGRISFEVDENEVSGSFTSGDFNGYVFTDVFDEIPAIANVILNETTNSLGLEASDITFTENTIEVNVESLAYSPGLSAVLDIEFVEL